MLLWLIVMFLELFLSSFCGVAGCRHQRSSWSTEVFAKAVAKEIRLHGRQQENNPRYNMIPIL